MADGVYTEIKFYGTFAQKRLIMPVITDSFEMTPLNSPAITRTIPLNALRGTIPILGNTPVASQLRELEESVTANKGLEGFDVQLLKDRVRLSVTDEAEIETMAAGMGSMMTMQQAQNADALASNLNKLIATQLDTTPQLYNSGDAGNWASVKPTLAVGKMAATMGIYKPTAIVMGTLAGEYYVDAVGDKVSLANLAEWRNAATMHPTLNIPVYISTDIDDLDASGNKMVFAVSNRVPGVLNVVGAIKAHNEYDANKGADIYTYNIWRTPFSNVRQTSGNLNLGVIKAYMSET
ncbi:MAG: hypothetical protein WC340_17145 [Kiritimatiellia bacterium]